MPTSANCPKNPSDVRADVGIRAPILPLWQQPLVRLMFSAGGPVIEMARAGAGRRSARFSIQTFAHRLDQLLRTVGLLKEYRRRAREESGSRQIRAVATGVDYF